MLRLRRVLVSVLALLACLPAAEIARRMLDGYEVWRAGLVKNPHSLDLTWSDARSNEALWKTIALDAETDGAWFDDRPAPIDSQDDPPWVAARRGAFEAQANYVWNASRLGDRSFRQYLARYKGRLDDIFAFRAPNDGPFPSYRLYPGIQSGFGRTNRFGWRGGPIDIVKPANVIRIGALGDSTTNGYPALVEHWLNRWSVERGMGVRFEVVNAARPATGALDAAAIFEHELAPADFDYVIVYGFGNGLHLADQLIALPPGIRHGVLTSWKAPDPGVLANASTRAAAALEPAAQWSAAAAFLRDRITGRHGDAVRPEPPKPDTQFRFPPDVNEASPDLERIAADTSEELMRLGDYVRALNRMDVVAKERNVRLLVATFRVLAFDGMRAGGNLYRTINEDYWWPYTYAEIRRLMTFYNRTLRKWADWHAQGVIEIDERMPWRPELYGDGIHALPAGEALHAWIVLQQLMPRIRADLAAHVVPTPARHEAWDAAPYWTIERVKVAALPGE